MIAMQAGVVELFAFLVVMVLVVIGIGYFIALPFYALRFFTKRWRARTKSILITAYIMASLVAGFLFWFDVFATNHQFGGIYRPSSIMFWSLPLIFIVAAALITRIRSRSHVVTSEGCNQPSGCKMEEKEHE